MFENSRNHNFIKICIIKRKKGRLRLVNHPVCIMYSYYDIIYLRYVVMSMEEEGDFYNNALDMDILYYIWVLFYDYYYYY